jgi:hypothetical protein
VNDYWVQSIEEGDNGHKWELFTLKLAHPFLLRVSQSPKKGKPSNRYYGELVFKDNDGCLSDPIIEVKEDGPDRTKNVLMNQVHIIFSGSLPLMGPRPEKPKKKASQKR